MDRKNKKNIKEISISDSDDEEIEIVFDSTRPITQYRGRRHVNYNRPITTVKKEKNKDEDTKYPINVDIPSGDDEQNNGASTSSGKRRPEVEIIAASTSSGKRRPEVEIIAVIPKKRKPSIVIPKKRKPSISDYEVNVDEVDEEMESYADVEDNIDDEETIEMEEELEQEMKPEDELRLLEEDLKMSVEELYKFSNCVTSQNERRAASPPPSPQPGPSGLDSFRSPENETHSPQPESELAKFYGSEECRGLSDEEDKEYIPTLQSYDGVINIGSPFQADVPPLQVSNVQMPVGEEDCLWQPSNCILSDEQLQSYQQEAKEMAEGLFGNWDYDGSPLLGDCPLDLQCLMKCNYNQEEALLLLEKELKRLMDEEDNTSKFDTAEEVDENEEVDYDHNVKVTPSTIKEGGKEDVEMKDNIDSEPNVEATPSTTNIETPKDAEMKDNIDSEVNVEATPSTTNIETPKDAEMKDNIDSELKVEATPSTTNIETPKDAEMKDNIDSELKVETTPSTTNIETPEDAEMKDNIVSELNVEVSSSTIKVVSPKIDDEDDDKTDPDPNLEGSQSSTEVDTAKEDEGEITEDEEGTLSSSVMDRPTVKEDDFQGDIISDPNVESTSQSFVTNSMGKDDTKEPNAGVDESGVQSQMRTNNGASNAKKEKELEASCSIE